MRITRMTRPLQHKPATLEATFSPNTAELARRRTALATLAAIGTLGVLASLPLRARAQTPGTTLPSPQDLIELLRAGGVAVMLRHATTTPGVGDPPGFKPGQCSTQRNLSDAGRAEASRIGAWFKRHALEPSMVRSSAWCRCIDTAQLAFGRHQPWPAIDSSFGSGDSAARLPLLREGLREIKPGRFEVWVTHQTNITSATGANLGMGEAVIARLAAGGEWPAAVVGRLSFVP